MSKIQQVKKAQLWSVRRTFCIAAGLGCGVATCTAALLILTQMFSYRPSERAGFVICFGFLSLAVLLPAVVIICRHPRLKTWRHAVLYGAVFGLVGMICLAVEAVTAQTLIFRGPVPPLAEFFLDLLQPVLIVTLASTAIFTMLWVVSRKTRGPLRITGPAQCPTCEYSLVGNVTGVCPECGQPFRPEDVEAAGEVWTRISAESRRPDGGPRDWS